MELVALFNRMPFADLLGIEVTDASGGEATARLSHSPELLSNPAGDVAHGGATYALADTVGGAAVMSLSGTVTPTIDMRIDYLAPATTDLVAEAGVVRYGDSVAVVRVEIHDADGTHVATAHGTYKTSGQGEETPWGEDTEVAQTLPDDAR
jgi:uncharacterized protein (TIGR00369 family)